MHTFVEKYVAWQFNTHILNVIRRHVGSYDSLINELIQIQ